jgi:type I restriction enzyme M protein
MPKEKVATRRQTVATNGQPKNGLVKEVQQSTAQQLASIVKTCRDIMRKDKGLSGDLDRLPMLTWIMFLKFLDDMESIRAEEAKLAGKRFRSAMEAPYRWRDWATNPQGITGRELIAFINQDEAMRPDGKRGDGLFAYLRSLRSANGDRRDVIAKVFQGTFNRMTNGYLLRDVVNKINEIHFTSRDEIHTLGALYESMLREMRDAAGDSGEFYTPRPLVKFIVAVMNPQLGETILDPAAGTGGFLVESFDPENTLRFPLREIGDKDRVDLIMTNPPFGGEEERGILSNFPEDKKTAETALLFLQLIMRKLRRPIGGAKPGRCGMVVPNGTLFGDGVCARIKEELLKEFNLHTIVRLPNGVFAPYTSIPTNLLFFDRSGSTKEIWYYEQPLPKGRKTYTKTQPMRFEEFEPCLAWWNTREENERAWKVKAEDVLKYDGEGNLVSVNLDIKNPTGKQDFEHKPPEKLIEDILANESQIAALLQDIRQMLTSSKP